MTDSIARWVLYVRLNCHLCEAAAAELARAGLAFAREDIDRDAALREEYGTLVPVLKDCAQDCEWAYPFPAGILASLSHSNRRTP